MNSSIKHGIYDGITRQMESDFQIQVITFLETKNHFEVI